MALSENVFKLFLLDKQILGLRGRVDAAMDRQKAEKAKLAKLQTEFDQVDKIHKQGRARVHTLENQVKDLDAKVAKLREQMNNVKNNKEFSALLVEVNTFKDDKGKLEDQALALMTQVEDLGKQLAAKQGACEERKRMLAGADTEATAATAEISEQLESLLAQRKAAAALLPADALAMFDKANRMHEGEGLAEVHENSRKHLEYACDGCNLELPFERVNKLLSGSDTKLICCPSCSRILYLGDDLRANLAPAEK